MKQVILAIFAFTVTAPAALADDDTHCRHVPLDRWMSKQQVIQQVEGSGVKVRSVEIDDGCYDVTALRNDGLRVEIRVDPETGAQISIDDD